jgi:hypothetical protein
MANRNRRAFTKKQQPAMPPAPHPAVAKTAKAWSILIAIGSVSGFVSLAEKAWSVAVEQTKPVRPLNLSADPFSLPIVIKNPSSIFAMTNITWICGVDSVGDHARGGSMTNVGIMPGRNTNFPTNISPGQSLLVRCPIGGAGGSDATIVPIVKYETLGIAREYHESSLTWLSKATPPQWIEGKPLR